MRETDEAIYSRFLESRDEGDLRALLERHGERLTLFLYGMVRDMDDAEELMLDAFAQAAAGAGYSGRSSFKTWLFAIGKNLARRHLRRARRFAGPGAPEGNTAQAPETDLLKRERDRQLYRAMHNLNDDYRQILMLLYFEEMSHDEARQVMGKSIRQVYHLADRARAALKKELERMGFEDARQG